MRKMEEEKKGNIVRHIQSAKQWLEQAEHAVNSECSTRGELDLILAKAEVQLAQEKRGNTAELPTKIITYALRSINILIIILGGLAVCMLLMPYLWHHVSQGMHLATAPHPKIQLEAPALTIPDMPAVTAPPLHDEQKNSEIPRGETASENPAPVSPATRDKTLAAQSEPKPAATAQSQTTAVSEQEIRTLMRTAEQVLKATK